MSLDGQHPIAAERRLEALRQALGPCALAALQDPQVVEIMANPDGRLILDRLQGGRVDSGERSSRQDRERVIRLIADHMGEEVRRDDPRVSGVLPVTGERFQGFLPPVTQAPAYAIRKRPGVIHRLESYVAAGAMTEPVAARLRAAASQRENILISGGAGSGKTTLANAILAEPAFAGDRVLLIEDVPELQCSSWDTVACLTRRQPKPVTVADLVRDALRMRPDRIVVGEMRDGAWNTGHPGGLATIHANSAKEALSRFEDLVGEVSISSPRRTLGQALNLIVHTRRTISGRRIELVSVTPARGGYQLESVRP
jgi:P-type conjugative transfer ATPase TrbB